MWQGAGTEEEPARPGPSVAAQVTTEEKDRQLGNTGCRQPRVGSSQPCRSASLVGHLPGCFSREAETPTVPLRPHLLCLNMSPGSPGSCPSPSPTLDIELDCTKGPFFHGGRNPDVRVILLESSEENPQLTWTWTYS